MTVKQGYSAVAVSLTVLDGLVAVYYGSVVWTAWSSDIWARGLRVMLAASGIPSLANVWAHTAVKVVDTGQAQSAFHDPVPLRARVVAQGEGDV